MPYYQRFTFSDKVKMRTNKKLSLRVDALHQRIDDVKRLPASELREKALRELRSRLRRVEKRIPQ